MPTSEEILAEILGLPEKFSQHKGELFVAITRREKRYRYGGPGSENPKDYGITTKTVLGLIPETDVSLKFEEDSDNSEKKPKALIVPTSHFAWSGEETPETSSEELEIGMGHFLIGITHLYKQPVRVTFQELLKTYPMALEIFIGNEAIEEIFGGKYQEILDCNLYDDPFNPYQCLQLAKQAGIGKDSLPPTLQIFWDEEIAREKQEALKNFSKKFPGFIPKLEEILALAEKAGVSITPETTIVELLTFETPQTEESEKTK